MQNEDSALDELEKAYFRQRPGESSENFAKRFQASVLNLIQDAPVEGGDR